MKIPSIDEFFLTCFFIVSFASYSFPRFISSIFFLQQQRSFFLLGCSLFSAPLLLPSPVASSIFDFFKLMDVGRPFALTLCRLVECEMREDLRIALRRVLHKCICINYSNDA